MDDTQNTTTTQAKSLKAGSSEGITTSNYVIDVRLYMIFGSLTLAVFLVMLDTSIVATAIPIITDEFHSLHDLGWYGSAYQLGSAVLQPLSGKVYQHFNLKWSFISFFAVFEVGSAICGAAQTSAMLIVGRAIASIGASGLINGGISIIAGSLPLEKRPTPTAIMMGISQLGVALGPVIGGAFTTGYTWRWCFYINLPLGSLVVIPLAFMHIPEQIPKEKPLVVLRQLHRHLDLVGFVIFAPAVIQLLLALTYGGHDFAWNSAQVIGLFCGSGANFIVWFIWNYYKGDDALLPCPIIKRQAIWASGLNYTFFMSAMLVTTYFLPVYFQAVKGVSALMSGVYLLAMIVPHLLALIISGTLVNRIGLIPPFSISSGVVTAIGTGLFGLLRPDTSTGKWVGYMIITGFGRGIGFVMPLLAVQNATTADELSSATAFIVWAQYIGPTIFLALFNVIFDTGLRSGLTDHAPNVNYATVVAVGATQFRQIVSPQDLAGVILAYSDSLDRVFYTCAALAAAALLAGFGMGWKKINKKQKTDQGAESVELSEMEPRAGDGRPLENAEIKV